MVKKKLRSVVLATALAVLAGSIGSMLPTGMSYAQENHGTVEVSISDTTVTIGNDAIKRTFDKSGDKLKTTKIENLLGSSTFTPSDGSEEFVISGLAETQERKLPTTALTSLSTTGWTITGTSVSTSEGGGYQALLDSNLNNHYHSNYGTGQGTNGTLPIDLTIDRGEGSTSTPFQTFGYRPRKEGPNINGNIHKYELYVSNDKDTLFTGEGNMKKSGTFQYTGIYTVANSPEFIYTSFPEEQTGRYVGLRVLSSVGGNRYAAGTQIGLFTEKFDSFDEVVSPTIKASDLTLASVTETDTNAVINNEQKTGKMLTFAFNSVSFGGGTAEVVQKVVMYNGDHFMRKFLEIKLSDENARISYIDGEYVMTGTDDKTWTIPTNKGGVVAMSMERSILGQPIYINGMFLGSEFPAADNQIVDKLGRLRYWTGKNFADFTRDGQLTDDGKYISWQTVVGASHSDGSDRNVIQSDFFEYIYSIATPSEFRIQYNSWYDNMMRITDENILTAFSAIDKNLSKTGVRPLDSYVVDDGWNLYRKTANTLTSNLDIQRNGPANEVNTEGFWMFNSKFPNKLAPSSELVQNFGSNFGVWVGPRGGYNYFDKLADIITEAGNGSKAGGSIDVADARYVEKFEDMSIKFMEDYQVNYWKWDGFADNGQFNHFPQGEGVVGYSDTNKHMYGGPYGYYHITDLWEKWIGLFKNVRVAEQELGIKNLWISITCYVNPSPWHLQWSNSVWMQCTADRGERTNSNAALNNKMDNMLTYRDGAYYDFLVNHEFQFPLANIYNHDPIYGKEDTGITASSMNGEQFRNYMFMQGTRGTAFWELYYSDSILNEEKYLINADFLEWEEENFSKLRNAKMIGGTPASTATLASGTGGNAGTQEAYGFSCFDGNAGFISMRNPAAEAKELKFTLDDAIGVTVDGSYHMSIEHAYATNGTITPAEKDTFAKGDTVTITLQPGETQVWSLSQTQDTTAPELDKIYVKSEDVIQVRSSERLYAEDIQFTVTVNGTQVDAEKTAYADLRSFDLKLATPLEDGDKVVVTTTGATDRSKNDLDSSITTTYYFNNIIAEVNQVTGNNVVISESTRSMVGDNGFTVSAKVQTDDKGKVLVKQGDSYSLGINAQGNPYFTYNGITATAADVVISSAEETIIAGVKENNGLIKIYVDGEIEKAAYKEDNKEHEVVEADIVANAVNGTLADVKVFSQSLGYDEVPSTALADLVAKIEGEKDSYTTESWNNAEMDTKLTAAKAAITSGDRAEMDSQYDILYAAYKTLIPATVKNLALNKNVEADWLDPDETSAITNAGSPLSRAVDGVVNNVNSYAIFGKDGTDKPSYITIDLGEVCLIDEVKLYRYWTGNRTYKNTALVISNDQDFTNKEVLYYSGTDDVMSLGQNPTDDLYVESANGKVLHTGETKEARYIRLYAQGVQNGGQENHIIELQVLGMPKGHNPYDVTTLEALIAQAKAEEAKTDVYMPTTVEALTEAREDAEAVVAAVKAGTQEDKSLGYILNAEDALKEALAGLRTIYTVADYSAVDAAIARAEALDPADYRDFSAVTEAINAVERDLADTEQSRVDAMAAAINDAIDALVEIGSADYNAVNAAIARAEALDPADYKDFSAVTAAINAVVRDLPDTEQSRVDAMAAAINTAIDNLEPVDQPVDPDLGKYKTELSGLIKQAEEAAASGKYTDESLKAVDTHNKTAKTVLGSPSSTEAQFQDIIAKLKDALAKLEEKTTDPAKPDLSKYKTELNSLIKQADEAAASGKYTDESLKAVDTHNKTAKTVLNAASSTEAQFTDIIAKLKDALAKLEEKKTDNPPKEKPWIFTDVDINPGAWKYESVKYVYYNDIMGAISGTTLFQPDRPLSRSMFATVLYRMADSPAVTYADTFSDVPAGKWYSDAIIWANQKGIVQGLGDGSFGIDNNITREQIAKMLFEYADKVCGFNVSDKKDLAQFTDADAVSGWAVGYMQWATAVEMITGKPNDAAQTSFRMDPKGEATRAECAAMLMRFENKYVNQ